MSQNDVNPLISIVLPIYNVGQYLDKCLGSIRNQTYSNIEVLMIDDGSTDDCYNICETYASNDERFIAVHKENGGVSSARNEGIRRMKGKYMTFIDPDDIVSVDYVETLYNAIKNYKADISICGVKTIYSEELSTVENRYKDIEVFTHIQAIEKMLYQDEIDVNAWGKMYQSSLFDGIQYPFGEINEDTAVTYKLFAKANKIVFDSYKCYFYVQRPGSIMHQEFAKRKMSLIRFSEECLNYVNSNIPEVRNAAVCKHVTDAFVLTCKIYDCSPLDKESLAECWNIIRKYRLTVLKDGKARKKTKIACLTSYFGPRFVAFSKRLNSTRDEKRGTREI